MKNTATDQPKTIEDLKPGLYRIRPKDGVVTFFTNPRTGYITIKVEEPVKKATIRTG